MFNNQNFENPNSKNQPRLMPGYYYPNIQPFNPYMNSTLRNSHVIISESRNNVLDTNFNRFQQSNNVLNINPLIQNNGSELLLPEKFSYVYQEKLKENPDIIDIDDSKNKDVCSSKDDSKNKDVCSSKDDSKSSSKKYDILSEEEVFSKINIINFINNLPEIIKENKNMINLKKNIDNDNYIKFENIREDIFLIIINCFIELKDSLSIYNNDLNNIFDYILEINYKTKKKIKYNFIFKYVKSNDEISKLNLTIEDYNKYMEIIKEKWNSKKLLKCNDNFLKIEENTRSTKRKTSNLNEESQDSKFNNEVSKPRKLRIRKKQKVSESNTDIQQNDDDVLNIQKVSKSNTDSQQNDDDDDVLNIQKYIESKKLAQKDNYNYKMEKKQQVRDLKNELLKIKNKNEQQVRKLKNENEQLRRNIKELKSLLDKSFLI